MKGILYANPTFIRKNIRQPTVLSVHPLVVYDDNRLYFNNLSIKWQAKDIVNCTYSKTYKVLMILTDDYKISVFTQQLQLITHLKNWEPKYIVGFQLIEELNIMLLIGTQEIELMKVNVVSNIKKTKFLSSMKFNIKRQAHLTVENQHKLKWNKGYGYQIEQDLLYVWSLQDIHFYSLSKLTIKTKINNLTKKELSITTAFFSNYYKYTVTGLLNGDIKVWRLPINPLFVTKETLVHNFTYHSREVQQILQGNDQKTIITYALDMYICFMSIQTFELLRIFNFSGQYSKIFLYDHLSAYAIKDMYLGELNFGKNLQFISEMTGHPIYHDYSPHNLIEQEGKFQKIQLTLGSNLGIQINMSDIQTTEETNKIDLTYIYPPLKSKNVTQLLSCPFQENLFYLMVEDGDVFRAKLEANVGKIDFHYNISKLYDSQKHTLHQIASFISFLHIVPPSIDTEIMERTVDKTFNKTHEQKLQLYSKLKLLTIGCDKGSIIFVQIDNFETIYARVSYHRQQIIKIQEVYNKTNKNQWLVSICLEKYLKIIIFNENKANCIYTIFCGEIYNNMYGFQSALAIIFQKGLFQLCRFQEYSSQPKIILNRQSINHQDEILSFSFRYDTRLILTGGKDNRIKIWTMYKILLYEIIIDEMLKYCVWANNMNIIVVQNGKLCCLRNVPLTFKPNQIQKYNAQFQQSFDVDDIIDISKYIEDALIKNKQRHFKIRSVRKHQSLNQSPVLKGNNHGNERQKTSPYKDDKKSFNRSILLGVKTPIRQKKTVKTEGEQLQKQKNQNEFSAIKRHLQELANLKKITHESVLPKIKPKNEDIFVQFMREKLLNKKLLTRRDITLNRIIMKNLIKDHIGSENQMLKSFKLQ